MLPKFFFIISILFSLIFTHSSYSQCVDDQKRLLLELKNELIFNASLSRKLVLWNQTDECCKWYGVECDVSGYVVSLQLDYEFIYGGIGDSSSLFSLKYLEKLNLAYNELKPGYFNDYTRIPIPKGIRNLTYLTYLNLSYAGFCGQIPVEMLSLRRLVSLDISSGYLSSFDTPNFEMLRSLDEPNSEMFLEYPNFEKLLSLDDPNLEMFVQNLTGLRELYLDGVNITSSDERRKWSHIISSYLPNLTSLSFRGCGLSGPLSKSFWKLHSLSILRLDGTDLSTTVPDLFINFSSLTTLSLAYCRLNGSFPSMIFHIPTLQYLDLTGNVNLSGSIPPFTQPKSLKSIDLFGCQFTGSIPFTFANLTELSYVDLSFNLFTGSLSSSLFEGLSNLVHLNLAYNSFTGYIPQSLFVLPLLQTLMLDDNRFTGQVEEFHIVNVSNIFLLDLRGNRLEGPIPDSFFQLKSLDFLSLFGNLFNNTFQLDKIHSLANLKFLDLSDNNLSINSSTYGFPRLEGLGLASCNMYDFPDFIKHSEMLEYLDLSNNRIAGEIPSWIWGKQLSQLNLSFNLLTDLQKPYNISASLNELDLRSNQLRGELHLLIPPNITHGLWYLLLGNNSFKGSIPISLCSATALKVLDLSVNKLSGSIPSYLLENLVNLRVLDLHNNNLEGKIPKSLERCNQLQFMNVGNNIINDTFPCMLSSRLRVLVLHSNRFHGEVRCHSSWPELQILDISSNHFSGNLGLINFSSWSAMVLGSDVQLRHDISRYFSWVALIMKGIDLQFDRILPEFNVIDLSCNNFQGEIPNAIGDLTSLHVLNFSHNVLKESIPKSFGQLSKLESLDLSHNQLSGVIPVELAGLTFLSVLNLSYNKLVGMIPNGRQLQTFPADSFKGNPGLCGFNLNISCSHTDDDSDLSPQEDENVEEKKEIEWEYVSAALGYVVGLGSFVWLLLFCRSFRVKYFGKIEEVVEDIFYARDMRRRRAVRRH